MHQRCLFACALVLLMAATRVPGAAETAPTDADIEKAVAALADYDLGKPHEPVIEVERLLRATAGQPALRQHLERQLARMLESPVSDECKYFICRLLWRIGGDESLPVLQRMASDEKTAHIACLASGTNPSPKATAVLRSAMANAQGSALVCIVGVLGDRRDEESVETIGKLAASRDAAVAEAALAALGRIGTPAAAEILAKARAGGDPKARDQASLASLQCARRLAAAGKTQDAAAIYQDVLKARQTELLARGALAGLLDLGGPEAAALAIATLRSDNRVMRGTAIAAIPRLPGEGLVEKFAAEIPHQPAAVQAMILDALADRNDPAVRPVAASAARGQNPEVRTAALKALGKVGDASSVALVARAAAEGETDDEKRAALVSLRNISGEGVDAAIVEAMKAARPDVRAQLIEILHDRGASGAVPALLKETASADAAIRAAAFKALGRLAEARDLGAIVGAFTQLQGDAGPEAEGALVAVSRKVADEAARADAVLAALAIDKAPAAKAALLRVLRGIGNAKALDALLAAAKDADAVVQDAAVRALADWPDARAEAALRDTFRTATNQTHRVLALRGIVRLLGQRGGPPSEATVKEYEEVLRLAQRPEEKKLVLGGLAALAHPAALAAVEPCLADDAVKAEAAAAALAIARAAMPTHRAEVQAAMRKMAETARDENVRKQAEVVLREIEGLGDYLVAWQVCGPYTQAGKKYTELFDTVFPPEKPDAKDVAWRGLPVSATPGQPVVLDLLKAVGGTERCAYVRTWLISDRARDARLELGVDDGIKAWLNGQVVLAENRGGACVPGSFKADVSLREGANLLVMKVTQSTGPWAFCVRLCGRDGKTLPGVHAEAAPR